MALWSTESQKQPKGEGQSYRTVTGSLTTHYNLLSDLGMVPKEERDAWIETFACRSNSNSVETEASSLRIHKVTIRKLQSIGKATKHKVEAMIKLTSTLLFTQMKMSSENVKSSTMMSFLDWATHILFCNCRFLLFWSLKFCWPCRSNNRSMLPTHPPIH